MRIESDENRCLAMGNCVRLAPDHFDQSEETGTVIVTDPNVSPDELELVRRAVGACPVKAVWLDEHAQ